MPNEGKIVTEQLKDRILTKYLRTSVFIHTLNGKTDYIKDLDWTLGGAKKSHQFLLICYIMRCLELIKHTY